MAFEYECPLCPSSLIDLFRLHVHCMRAHSNDFFTCPWCTQPFSSRLALHSHANICAAFNENEPREGYIDKLLIVGDQCLECEARFPSSEKATEHYKKQHLRFVYVCTECQQDFNRYSAWDKHYADCKRQARLRRATNVSAPTFSNGHSRPATPRMIATNSTILGRYNAVERPPKVMKTKANNFLLKASGAEKRRIMKKFNQNYCSGCKIKFAGEHDITHHFRKEHQTKVFRCNQCGNAYLSPQALKMHRKQYRKDPAHKKVNNEAVTLNERSNSSQNQRIFCCPNLNCKLQTTSRESLDSHIREEHPHPEGMIGVPSTSAHIKEEPKNLSSDKETWDLTADSDSD